MTDIANKEQPRVYMACLAAYNNGLLHGQWIDVPESVEELNEAIQSMLACSPLAGAEEWAMHDYEGFGSLTLSEYQSLQSLIDMAALINEHGEDLASGVLDHCDNDIEEATAMLEERYNGCYNSVEEFAEYYMDETQQAGSIPPSLALYIDYEKMGHDMAINGDIVTVSPHYNEVHVFWGH